MTAEAQKPSIRKQRRTYQGVVLSDHRDKTIKVVVEQLTKHPRYSKYMRRRSGLHVHDEKNEARAGDVVEITETRPISKTKTWRLVRIVRRSQMPAPPHAETDV